MYYSVLSLSPTLNINSEEESQGRTSDHEGDSRTVTVADHYWVCCWFREAEAAQYYIRVSLGVGIGVGIGPLYL